MIARNTRFAGSLIACATLSACATPAASVKVPTMPMGTALDKARTTRFAPEPAGGSLLGSGTAPAPAPAAPTPTAGNEPPRPIVTAADVRLAYLYEWVDGEGNHHFGSWVAIAVAPPRWILSNGAAVPLDPASTSSAGAAPLAAERPR
jgi:hypothetical protein